MNETSICVLAVCATILGSAGFCFDGVTAYSLATAIIGFFSYLVGKYTTERRDRDQDDLY